MNSMYCMLFNKSILILSRNYRNFNEKSSKNFIFKIGAITVGVMLIQPVGALLRCDEGSKSRIIFNWSHRIFGFLSFLLGRKFDISIFVVLG
ncbi:unnamed protein product [Brugia timori]|uniref:Cytochrome b561 domain-containing protein n=1 Tax=Brugia timori TaxID=42155 RepID=A0A3P7XAM6_9BILA|nr:unnamed protein product [Brugia timori]